MGVYGDWNWSTEKKHKLVKQDISDIVGIFAGNVYLKKDGTLWTQEAGFFEYEWLLNDNLSVDNGHGFYQITKVKDVIGFEYDGDHALALKSDGTMYVWGHNQEGNVEFKDKLPVPSKPTKIEGLSNIKQIEASGEHTIALTRTGKLYGWGNNADHQISSANTLHIVSPIAIPGIESVKKVAVGENFTLALTQNGSLYFWGNTLSEEITATEPTLLDNMPEDIVDMNASIESYVAALTTTSGEVYQLNFERDKDNTNILTPLKIPNITNGVEAACESTCYALTKDGTVLKWSRDVDSSIARTLEGFKNIVKLYVDYTASDYVVGLDPNGDLWGFGANYSRQFGFKVSNNIYKPTIFSHSLEQAFIKGGWDSPPKEDIVNRKFIKGSTGRHDLFFINEEGKLLTGATQFAQNSDILNYGVRDVFAGDGYLFVVKEDGSVWSYGRRNEFGQLGNGKKEMFFNPIEVPKLRLNVA